jgi:hypothetical protein
MMTNHPVLHGDLIDDIKKHFTNLKAALAVKNCEIIVHGNGILKDL